MFKDTFFSFIITFCIILSAFFITQVLYIDKDSKKAYELIYKNMCIFENHKNIKIVSGTYDKESNKLYCVTKPKTSANASIYNYAVFYENGFYYLSANNTLTDSEIASITHLANQHNIRSMAINFRLNFDF